MKKNESTQVFGKNQSPSGKNRLKELIDSLRNYRWEVMGFLALVVIFLGCMGFDEYFRSINVKRSLWDIFYRTLQLFKIALDPKILDLNWKLELARWMAPIISAIAAANVLVAVFSEQFQLLKLQFFRNHIIICGLGNKGLMLAKEFKAYEKKVVAIEIDKENNNIKECRDTGSTVLIGNAMAPYILRRAGLQKAKYIFSVCSQDNINAEIAFQARKLRTEVWHLPVKSLTCIVHITDAQLCRLIKEREFETEKNEAFRLEFLNLFDQAAKTLIDSYPPFNEENGLQALTPHILIVGVGHLGESLVVHTVKKWSALQNRVDNKIKISIIDQAAGKKQKLFYARYPRLKEVCDIIPLEMDIDSPEFEEGQSFISSGGCDLSMAYICLDDDSLALSTALTLHKRFWSYDFPIVVRMKEMGLADLIKGDAHGLGRVHGFRLLDLVLKPELLLVGTHEILARAIHEEYCRDQLAKGETPASNRAVVPWDELPETLKDSNRRQADYLGVKLGKIGCYIVPMIDWNADPIEFAPEEIEKMAVMEHEDWVEERLKNGWKYDPGPKDIRRKRSSSLISWDKLSEEEKEKDRNPVRKMPQFLAKAGFQIYRREE